MGYDKAVPKDLKKVQVWFGSIIGRPIDRNSRMNLVSPKGEPMETEASLYIIPSPTLQPHQRIQIYNQQYWWRLLTALHDSFPLTVRLFGYADFNMKIGFPYLEKYPPNHWSLNILGNRIVQWAKEAYQEKDRELVLNALELDWGYNLTFIAPNTETLDGKQDSVEDLLDLKLTLSPAVVLYTFPYHLFDFREEFVKEDPEYWVEHDFPRLQKEKKEYFFILFRSRRNFLEWKELSKGEHFLLHLFLQGCTINEACELLESQPEEVLNDCAQNLQTWFQNWVIQGWLKKT